MDILSENFQLNQTLFNCKGRCLSRDTQWHADTIQKMDNDVSLFG